MTLDEFSNAVMIPHVLRMIGLPDTPEARKALHELSIAELADIKAKAEKEAA